MIRKQFTISGKVQGVWFRGGTREQALALGLTGYASNLLDGRVEVQVQGRSCQPARTVVATWPDFRKGKSGRFPRNRTDSAGFGLSNDLIKDSVNA